MISSETKLRLGLIGGGVLVALAVVVARVVVDGRAELAAGAAAEGRGADGQAEAIRHYLGAVRSYVPGSPHVGRALDRLEAIADVAEAGGDDALARQALEAVRAGLLGTRSFYTAFEQRLARADGRLAALYARTEDPRVDPGATAAARAAWHAARLAQRPGPALVYVVVALAGLGLWLGAALGFVSRGLDAGLRLRPGPAIASGVIFVVGFALFLAGLRLA